ncbi:MAG: hypothetical protein P8Y76_09035 [bacterium]
MFRSPWRAVAVGAVLIAAACAQIGPTPEASADAPQVVVASVLETLRADDAEQRRALAHARIAQRAKPDAAASRARLGLLLALLPAPLANSAQAEALLGPLAAKRDSEWFDIASIALAGVGQRRRLEARARLAERHAVETERDVNAACSSAKCRATRVSAEALRR